LIRAGLEHRGVNALDHVGTVQHERLVALTLQAAVILLAEVELLERRAHAAVVDDDTLGDGLEVVALLHSGNASQRRPGRTDR
jgi:hypothetical protein